MARAPRRLAKLAALEKAPVLDAAKDVSERLRVQAVPHAVVGGLALRAYGYERYTKDVDVLVPSDRVDVPGVIARRDLLRIRRFKGAAFAGTKHKCGGVSVDVLRPAKNDVRFLDAELVVPRRGELP